MAPRRAPLILVTLALLVILACATSASSGSPERARRDLPPGVNEAIAHLPEGSRQRAALEDGRASADEVRNGLASADQCARSAAERQGATLESAISEQAGRLTASYDVTRSKDLDEEAQATFEDDLARCEILHSAFLQMVLNRATALDGGTNVLLEEMKRLGIAE